MNEKSKRHMNIDPKKIVDDFLLRQKERKLQVERIREGAAEKAARIFLKAEGERRAKEAEFARDLFADEREPIGLISEGVDYSNRPGARQFFENRLSDLPDWVSGETLSEKEYNYWKWLRKKKKITESEFRAGPRVRPPEESILEGAISQREYFAPDSLPEFIKKRARLSGRKLTPQYRAQLKSQWLRTQSLPKWRKEHQIGRSAFYNQFSLETFDKRFLEQIGFMRKGKSLFLTSDDVVFPNAAGEIAAKIGVGGGHETEVFITETPGGKTTAGRKTSRSTLNQAIADWELSGNVEGENIFSRVAPSKYYGSPENWQIGASYEHTHFLSRQQQMLFGERVLGQTKFLKLESGKAIAPGSYAVTGVYRDMESLDPKWAKKIERFKKLSPEAAFREARGMYLSYGRGNAAGKIIRDQLVAVAGEMALDPTARIQKKAINVRRAARLRDTFFESLMSVETKQVSGFDAVRDFIEGASVGTRVKLEGGLSATIQEAVQPSEIFLKKQKGGFISLQQAIDQSNQVAREMLIPVKLVRTPGEFPAKGGGTYFDEMAVSVQDLRGQHLDYVKQWQAEKLHTNIKGGPLPEEGLFAKVIMDRTAKKPYLKLFREVSGSLNPVRMNLRSQGFGLEEGALDLVMKYYAGEQEIPKVAKEAVAAASSARVAEGSGSTGAVSRSALTGQPPPRAKTTRIRSAKVAPKIETAVGSGPFEGVQGKRMLVGLSIAAGALLLWGASKQKMSAPLTERDVRNSPYGNEGPTMPAALQRIGQSPVRIARDTGYSTTNVDMDFSDSQGTTDYRAMANTMSNMSVAVTGAGGSRTSLHVIDDSASMDRESVRRNLNQHLSI